MPGDRSLEAILAVLAEAAGRGDLRAVEALAAQLEDAVALFEATTPDAGRLAIIRDASARVAARLAAMRGGLHAARARLAEIGRLGAGEATYDHTGARRLIAPPASGAPLRR
jgi:hypothetical protein